MAFGFLSDIGSSIADIGKAGVGIAGLFGAFGGQENYSEKALKNQQRLQRAIWDETDPIYQQVYSGERENIQRSFAEGLRDLLIANRRAAARGTPYLINPERADESRAQAFAKMRENLGTTARDRARAYLATAAGLNAGALAYSADQTSANTAYQRAGGAQLAFDALGGLLNGDPRQTININAGGMGGYLGGNLGTRPTITSSGGYTGYVPSSPPRF